ncbi:HPP family protein [Pseudoalteromonas sp. SS15]|uniref:CBS domain-containing protein n=1 Tax=unclassified Pseudoalteromonas TaxID=194690 RepID=UPI0036F2ACC0
MLHIVSDLMTADPFAVHHQSTVKEVHDLMREKNIRHIPVIDDQGILKGMLTQKIMVAQVMKIMATYGPNAIERKEKQSIAQDIMATDFASIRPEQSLSEVAQFFVENRHGCMPVVDEDGKLLGILTSSDFVRLAAALLS